MYTFKPSGHRFDPYKTFRFRVKLDGRDVAGISKVSALKRTTEVIEYRDGGDPLGLRKNPGITKFEPLTLERGLTLDREFEVWASQVWKLGNPAGTQIALANFRKDIKLELHNEAGQVVLAFDVFRCWVSEYSALPELDASANAVAIESMVLQHEGCRRDDAVPEPVEPKSV
ncbi:T4-like virus tail tube protein gp19 [Caballeronia calidae]|uniref:T4-like virus tail tube protein gp19 n=1 Tax=Caballeronia calidae TaxID=1777139 RepID=A0A158EEL5_9BURK|nr:phage tail protein [Caballeronia calidae]SAL04836.1 T4-like virus tail tube protein gp19 [Caballeronia calidae]